MSGTLEAPVVEEQAPPRRRGRLLAVIAAVVLIAVLVAVALVVGGDDGGDGRTTPAAGSSAPPSSTPTSAPPSSPSPEPATPSPAEPGPAAGGTDGVPPALPAVPLDQPVEQAGITGSLVSVEAVDGQATGPGDIAGPALMVTVRLVNGTADDVPLDGVSVNLSTGADRTPASPLGDPRREPFAGTLAAGESAEGVYVFRAPAGDRVDVEVGYRPGQPIAVFSGAVR